jgi:hypothetical protein
MLPGPGNTCCCGGCTAACDPAYTGTFEVALGSIANGTCPNCTNHNGTYVLHLENPLVPCGWIVDGNGSCFFGGSLLDLDQVLSGSNYITRVTLSDSGGITIVRWEYDHGTTKPDCSTFAGLSLALITNNFSPSCDASAATCLVTSI